jgi:hypothetical protein
MSSNPITGLDRPIGFQEVEAPRFQDRQHMKVVRLNVLKNVGIFNRHINIDVSQHSGMNSIKTFTII